MDNRTNTDGLPPLIGDFFTEAKGYMDNVFADTWKQLNLNRHIQKAGLSKRRGFGIGETVYLLLLWNWLNVSSIAMFSKKALGLFSQGKKDVLYDQLKREDANGRALNIQTAKEVYRQHQLSTCQYKALVLDDSIKTRRGKKQEGVCWHFDHVRGKKVKGQQVLTLGLATEEAFLPVDSQLFISQSQANGLNRAYRDGRSFAAKRYQEARQQTKRQIADDMVKRTLRNGLHADYLLADAWFGTKAMIQTAVNMGLCGVFRMKKGPLRYRYREAGKTLLLNAQQLYKYAIKGHWKKVDHMPWKAVSLEVEVALGEGEDMYWRAVKLLFVRGVQAPGEPDVGKKDWALFLSTDVNISISQMLQVYALRWAIEVYFKEAKQHLGWLKEQTSTFASHTASIHLCAMRYLMLVHNKLAYESMKIGEIRSNIQEQLDAMSFAAKLWQCFRTVISGVLRELKNQLGCSEQTIIAAMDDKIQEFFLKSLQLDSFTLQLEYE